MGLRKAEEGREGLGGRGRIDTVFLSHGMRTFFERIAGAGAHRDA